VNLELVVFDWDGTLMDSTGSIVTAVQRAALAAGLPVPAAADIRGSIGLGLRTALAQAYPDLEPAQAQAFSRAFEAEVAREEARLFPGAAAMLAELRSRGLRLAVATGASRRSLDRHLESSGVIELFDATICVDEALSKPNPEMLERLMTRLGIGPRSTAMVGDTVYDLEMARQAGTAGLGVVWGAHPRERLAPLASLGLAEDVAGIPAALGL
jgi:phosphoglycolate phosphatase